MIRPTEVTTDDIVNRINDIVLADRRLKIREFANNVNESIERKQNILHEKLIMRNLSARWVPRLLRSTVWIYLSATLKSFWVVLGLFMKSGYITVRQK